MSTFQQQYGPWALITGASAGLGEEYARQLAARGLNTVLVARRQDRLEALGKELESAHGIQTRCISADLSSENFLEALAVETAELEIGLLVNNAGFTNSGHFLDNDLAAEKRLVDVNCRAVTLLAHHYGRGMRERRRGGMIFLASIAGFTGIPFWASYSASKSYDLLLAEALASELASSNVDVMAVCPGATRTEFASYSGLLANISVREAAQVVSGSLKRLGRRRVYVDGLLNLINTLATRLLPRRINSLLFGFVVRDIVDH